MDNPQSSHLQSLLQQQHFVVTAELGPPISSSAAKIQEKIQLLRSCADAYNITDCQTAVVRVSSIAGAVILLQNGLEPVMQMTTRDRNRIAIQADILGAAALGIKNCLCIAGDHQSFSAAGRLKGHAGAKNVYDIDSIQLIAILDQMRRHGRLQSGDPIEVAPELFIGAAWTPMAAPVEFRVIRLAKKIMAGADFVQTQGIYDIEQFAAAMRLVRRLELHQKVAILAGVIVPKSLAMLQYMHANVAGVSVPAPLFQRMANAKEAARKDKKQARRNQEQEGIKIAIELIKQLREIDGVRGVHLQAIEWEKSIPEIVTKAGLLPRPEPMPPRPSSPPSRSASD